MHRNLYHTVYENFPAWPCPSDTCTHGVLQTRDDGLVKLNSLASNNRLEPDGYHPEDDFGRFTATLECSSCGDTAMIVGTWGNEEVEHDYEYSYVECMYPKYILPAIPMISVPPVCSSGVKEALREAFQVYWSSPSSAANSIRISLERLMDDLGVPSEEITPNGKKKQLTLHKRIDKYGETQPDIAKYLEAAKWVGNSGSHGSPVTHKNILDVLEIVEHALSDIYPKDRSRVDAMAAKIIAAKGPA